jgi:hypothetical protein
MILAGIFGAVVGRLTAMIGSLCLASLFKPGAVRLPRLALALLAYVVINSGDETLTVSTYLQQRADTCRTVLPSRN